MESNIDVLILYGRLPAKFYHFINEDTKEKARESKLLPIPCLRPSHCLSLEDKQCRCPRFEYTYKKYKRNNGRQTLSYRARD